MALKAIEMARLRMTKTTTTTTTTTTKTVVVEGFNGILKPRQRGFRRHLRQEQRALLLLLLLLLVVVARLRRGESRSGQLSSTHGDSGDGSGCNGGDTGS